MNEHPLTFGGSALERWTLLASHAFPPELLVTLALWLRKAMKVLQTSFITGPCDYTMSYKYSHIMFEYDIDYAAVTCKSSITTLYKSDVIIINYNIR